MTGRAPPGKTYWCTGPGGPAILIDFPETPSVGWHYRGHQIDLVDLSRRAFRTAAGEFQFAEWQQWGAEGQPE